MTDIEAGVRFRLFIRSEPGREDKQVRLGERLCHGNDIRLRGTGFVDDLFDRTRSANQRPPAASHAECTEHPLAGHLLRGLNVCFSGTQAVVEFSCVPVECFRKPANLFVHVIGEGQFNFIGVLCPATCLGLLPRTHQRVLQQWQQVGIGAHVIKRAIHKLSRRNGGGQAPRSGSRSI